MFHVKQKNKSNLKIKFQIEISIFSKFSVSRETKFYFPIQNFEKMLFNISSEVTSPIISPR